MLHTRSILASLGLLGVLLSCGESHITDPGHVAPPAGPNFSVLPVPLDSLARITPLGYNNKIFPTSHTYWLTCDVNVILQGTRPCVRRKLEIHAPADGVVDLIRAGDDGTVRAEGPPGLKWVFGHVTPASGLTVGSHVSAGQVVATMYYDHGFDFGVINYGVTHPYLSPHRYIEEFLHGQSPIAQYPEPTSSGLAARVNTYGDPLGRLAYDVAGTAAGAWFKLGAPSDPNVLFSTPGEAYLLFLGRWSERPETRVVSVGQPWPGMVPWQIASDPSAPDWEAITPASGVVAVKLWNVGIDAKPNVSSVELGTFLIEMLDESTLRAEWFDTHDPVPGFTPAARTFQR